MKGRKTLFSLILALCLCFALAAPAWAEDEISNVDMEDMSTDNQVRMIDIENQIIDYLAEYHPDITFGSQEFIEYAVDVMAEDGDSKLATLDNYDDIRFYLGEYLYEFDQAQFSMDFSVIALSDTVFELTDEYKLQVLSEIREKNAEEIQAEEILYANRDGIVAQYSYDPQAAAAYATKYADRLAEKFPTYTKDCTNFASQAAYAGGISMNIPDSHTNGTIESTEYWYCLKPAIPVNPWHQSSSWVRVVDLYSYAVYQVGATSIQCSTVSDLQNKAMIGDIVQLRNSDGNWYHSVIITSGTKGNYKYCAHSLNRDNEYVSNLSGNNAYRIIRF